MSDFITGAAPTPPYTPLKSEPVPLAFYSYGKTMEEDMNFINMCEITFQRLVGTSSADIPKVSACANTSARPDT